jgi:uncharacterized RDD family membrane protein YckC
MNEVPSRTGLYAGAFTRTAAFIIDWLLITFVFGVLVATTQWFAQTFFGFETGLVDDNPTALAIGFGVWAFLYQTIGLMISGRTVGKSLVGLRVVTRSGLPLSATRAAVRVITLPLSFLVLGLGLVGIVLGREHRALHDAIAGTAVVYDWGDRPAELPAPLTRWLERKGAAVEPPEAESTTISHGV